jgi:cyanobactin maturation PatA/PatG family protease
MRTETALGAIEGLRSLWAETLGDPEICIAVLDGPVDESHRCFEGAKLSRADSLVPDAVGSGAMSAHGTHVTSVIFGQPGGPVHGVAPACRGLIIPVFQDAPRQRVPQLDLARAIEQAVQEGANIVNISGGESSQTGEADPLLARALRLCEDHGVLIVAAVGNDGCNCLNVPAATPSVLAVGALGEDGRPLDTSNWGESYLRNGILAPGEKIRGAVPGGGTALRTGTSFAVPIVAGIAGLLLSLQLHQGRKPHPRAVGEAILATAEPCVLATTPERQRCLAGVLNVPRARAMITEANADGDEMTDSRASSEPSAAVASGETFNPSDADPDPDSSPQSVDSSREPAVTHGTTGTQIREVVEKILAETVPATTRSYPGTSVQQPSSVTLSGAPANGITAAGGCECGQKSGSFLFAIGTIGYDFGTEARRDSFRQLMPPVNDRVANPHATEQMITYLEANPAESTKLIWTLNLDLTPIYAIEAELPYAREVYDFLRTALRGHIQEESSAEHIAKVSVPAVLTNRTVRLFSGQVVPVAVAQYRGLWGWNVNALIDEVVARFDAQQHTVVRAALRNFLDKVYYELRNLGQTSPDRALNYSATNAFQASEAMSRALHPTELLGDAGLYMLDDIDVSKSPFCRMDSDCWDVKLTFFDPENDRRARIVMRFTVDVSDELPVTLGPVRHWTASSH